MTTMDMEKLYWTRKENIFFCEREYDKESFVANFVQCCIRKNILEPKLVTKWNKD